MLSYATLCMLLFSTAVVSPQDLEYNSPVSLSVYYGVGDVWLESDKVTFNSLTSGMTQVPLLSKNPEDFKKLLNNNDPDEILSVKAVFKTSLNQDVEFRSFAKACSLLQSSAILNVNLDHSGSVIAASISPTVNCDQTDAPAENSKLGLMYMFKLPETGPLPDTATYINRLDKEREAKERGITPDNRSFFAKYWMYIVPVALFVLLSGSANADAPAAQ